MRTIIAAAFLGLAACSQVTPGPLPISDLEQCAAALLAANTSNPAALFAAARANPGCMALAADALQALIGSVSARQKSRGIRG